MEEQTCAVVEGLDPETEFLLSDRQTGNEWELFKENVRPLKRGRKVEVLNNALKAHTDNRLKNSLLEHRRRLIEAIDDYKGDDPLQPWLECIKWVQEAFPPGGDYSGLVVIYEQCVRTFWHSDRYKDDLRYLKVWLEYAANCVDAETIYSFLDANEIGKSHSVYYVSYALHVESKNKTKLANEIYNLGISRDAQPLENLKEAYRKFIARSMRRPKATDDDEIDKCLPSRSFGTVLSREDNHSSNLVKKNVKPNRAHSTPLAILNDNVDAPLHHEPDPSKTGLNSWHSLGTRAERVKENNPIPAKWTSYKVPRRAGFATGVAAPGASIEVFVDEECEEMHKMNVEGVRSSSALQLRHGDGRDLKKETELLRENPLRNFPANKLPR